MLLIAVPITAGASALLLAWFMYFLTHSTEMRLSERQRVQMLDFVRLKRNESIERKDRKPDRPEVSDLPKAPRISQPISQASSLTGQELALAVTAPVRPGRDLEIGRTGLGLGTGDGDYLPIVKVAPMYPRRAQQLGITGECLVRFTVTTSGTVRDVEVVPDGCSDPLFARPSIEAARRFKYKPRVIDGTPVEVLNVYNMFHFKITPTSGAEQ